MNPFSPVESFRQRDVMDVEVKRQGTKRAAEWPLAGPYEKKRRVSNEVSRQDAVQRLGNLSSEALLGLFAESLKEGSYNLASDAKAVLLSQGFKERDIDNFVEA